jgi:hypothetical protein
LARQQFDGRHLAEQHVQLELHVRRDAAGGSRRADQRCHLCPQRLGGERTVQAAFQRLGRALWHFRLNRVLTRLDKRHAAAALHAE